MTIKSQKISLFQSAKSEKQKEITISDYFEGIKSGQWQDCVIDYKNGKIDKTKIPAVTPSGLFDGRKDSDLKQHSGILCIDIDGKDQSRPINEVKQQLKILKEIIAIHLSLSQNGLAVYFRIRKDKHIESFEAITKLLINEFEIVPDMHCSNVGRLRFVSYDPDCYINYDAIEWREIEKKKKADNESAYDNHIYCNNDIDYIFQQIERSKVNIAPDYYAWLRIGFALAKEFGDAGRKYFRIISDYYPEKHKINPDKQYDNCLKSEQWKSGRITIRTLFYYAKLANISISSDATKKIITIAKIKRKQSFVDGNVKDWKTETKQYLKEFENIDGYHVDEIIEKIDRTKDDKINADEKSSLISKLKLFLKMNYRIRINDITGKLEINDETINDYIFNSICTKAKETVGEKATKELIDMILNSDFVQIYNPILEFFEKNKHLKPSGNVEALAECLVSDISQKDEDFVRYYLEKWLLSLIASAHGIYSILCLVLIGKQGLEKTNFFRELLPEELRQYFAQNRLDSKDSDIARLMCIKWLILDDEFSGKSKSDERRFKDLISTDVFTFRMPYARHFEDRQRLAVLCGTTNDEEIINDLTGNRRIIPIKVKYIDKKKYDAIDKKELFIELYHKWRQNPYDWFLTEQDIERLNTISLDVEVKCAEMELPILYFKPCEKFEPGSKFEMISKIQSILEKRFSLKLSTRKLSLSLQKLGFIKDMQRIDKNIVRGYWIKYIHNEDYNDIKYNNYTDDISF